MSSRSQQPCRQLNSQAIRGAALCYVSPIVVGRCSVVSAKCVVDVKGKALYKAWRNITRKRDNCDEAVKGIRNVAFFFSAISTSERSEVRTKEDKIEEESDSENDDIPCTAVSQEQIGSSTVKKYFPAISYWIALTTPNGAPANPIIVHRALLSHGVQVVAHQVSCQAHKESLAMKELYKVLKDHKNSFIKSLVDTSYRQSYVDEARELLESDVSSSEIDVGGSENVVKVCLVDGLFRPCLAKAVSKLLEAKLQVDSIGFDPSSAQQEIAGYLEEQNIHPSRMISDKLTVLFNDIEIAMKTLDYSVYRGKIYRKVKGAKYTHSFKCDAREFVNTLAANEHFKARLLKDMKKVCDIMSDPYCEVIRPLTIDYNLIEVKEGQCFNIKEREFAENAIPQKCIGKVSPRAYCPFDPTRPADPKYFKEILENSLNEDQIRNFCTDFMKLLEYNKKRHKDKVPCLVGAANSGKTSLFFPLLGIIHHSNIATITKQKSFNKAMISRFTEVIFIDEASVSTMDTDDWKTLTQGGYTAHDVKYQTAKSFINKCPMLITSQSKLKFKAEDQAAMDRRLTTYEFSRLPNPVKGAADWIRTHPMDCIVWASQQANPPDDHEDDLDDYMAQGQDKDGLVESEKDAIRSLSLAEILEQHSDEEVVKPAHSNTIDPQPDSSQETNAHKDNKVARLEKELLLCREGTLRFRQISMMLLNEKKNVDEEERRKEECRQRRQEFLKARGVSTQELELLTQDEQRDVPYPAPIAAKLEEYDRLQKEKEKKERIATAQKVFQNKWLKDTELKLHDLVQQKETVRDRSALAGIKGVIEILQHKLKMYHTNMGTLRMDEALAERRNLLKELGLLHASEEQLVDSVTCLPPFQSSSQQQGSNDQGYDSDGDDIFITPSSGTSREPAKRRASSQRSKATQKRGSHTSQGNTLDKYLKEIV